MLKRLPNKEYPPIVYIHKPRGRCTGHKRQCSGFLFVRNRWIKDYGNEMEIFTCDLQDEMIMMGFLLNKAA